MAANNSARSRPAVTLEPVAVIGSDYWPLPWYLRAFDQIGYWQKPPAGPGGIPAGVRPAGNDGGGHAQALEKSHVRAAARAACRSAGVICS